jgi:hypothetical protein
VEIGYQPAVVPQEQPHPARSLTRNVNEQSHLAGITKARPKQAAVFFGQFQLIAQVAAIKPDYRQFTLGNCAKPGDHSLKLAPSWPIQRVSVILLLHQEQWLAIQYVDGRAAPSQKNSGHLGRATRI